MAELSAVPFSALPPASDGYTVLYENDQVCRSDKKLSELVGSRTSSFLTKASGDELYQEKGNYLVPGDLDEYATLTWVENEISKIGSYVIVNETTGEDNHPVVENPSTKVIYLTKQTEGKFDNYNEWIYKDDTDVFECIGETTLDLENYYTKTETSGAGELSAAFNKYLKIPTNIEANKQYAYSTTGWNEIVANADQYETETVTIRHKSGWGDAPLYEVTANAGKLIYINQGSVPTTDIQQIELTLNNVENTDKPYYAYVTATKILNLCAFVVKDENDTYFKPADCKSYCYLVGDGNSNQKVYLIEFLPNKTFFAHRIENTDNTKFIEVTKTTGKQYYDYVNKFTDNTNGYMPFIRTDQGIAVFTYKTIGGNIVFQTSPNENGEMQKITFVSSTFTIKTETISFNANSNSWKQLSEEHGSSGTLDNDNFCVYLGAENSSFNDSYTLGRNNFSEQGLNIGYNNKIDINDIDSLGYPGTFNIGKSNCTVGKPGAVNIGQGNSAQAFGVNIGEWSSACSGSFNLGTSNTATDGSVNVGRYNKSFFGGFCVGASNKASSAGYSIGESNSSQYLGVGIGQGNFAQNCGFCLGQLNKASANAIGIGTYNSSYNNSYCVGNGNSANLEGYVFGTRSTASNLGICVGNTLNATCGAIAIGVECDAQHGSIVMGAHNHGSGCNLVFGTNNNFSASNIIGHNNKALNSNIFGNRNIINKDLASNSALSAEEYTKSGYYGPDYHYESVSPVWNRNFVAGVGNSAEYAKNAYILGNENEVICDSSADYLDVDNDGFTYLFGYKNSAARNYDMAIGYKTIASGGENIAIGAPFETITGFDYGYANSETVNTQARGYKNIAIRSTITGINNIAYNSTLTGSLMNLTSTWVKEELSKVVDNQIKNTWISGTSTGNYTSMQRNIIDNSNIIFSSNTFNDNIITNTDSLNIVDKFSNNTILNSNEILISAIDEYSNANNNTLIGCSNFNLNSKNIVDNLFLNITAFHTTANRHIKDNILIKTNVSPCSSMSSINENIVFNSLIYGNNDSAYRGWGTSDDSNTTFTRNFIFGTNVGNYVYNTFSFSDNSNSQLDYYRLSNTIRTFNFGDNGITKAENSFVFGLQNTATSIGRSFVFGYTNNLYKAPTNSTQDYIMDAFVFGMNNNLINECTYDTPTLERTTIFGQHNYIKSKNTCSDNYIVGLNNSITYFTNIPTKSDIINYITDRPWPEYETNSAAFQTTRNRIFGNCIKLTHGITDSFIAGYGNYVVDTNEYPASAQPLRADYNSIYMFGGCNVAYDGSNQLNIGYNNETSGHFAEAIGDGIKSKEQQLIIGKCNAVVDGTNRYSLTYNNATSSVVTVEPSGVIFAIGNGTYDYTTGYYTNSWDGTSTGYLDKNNNVIPEENINNEEYITRSNALIVSANGVVSANDYMTSAGYVITELIQQLENKITALETIISSNSANWVLTSQA